MKKLFVGWPADGVQGNDAVFTGLGFGAGYEIIGVAVFYLSGEKLVWAAAGCQKNKGDIGGGGGGFLNRLDLVRGEGFFGGLLGGGDGDELGVVCVTDVEKKFPPVAMPVMCRLNTDGSIRDQ